MMIAIPPKYAVPQGVGFYQREEYDPPGTGIWGEKEEFCGTAFLGTRVLGITVGRDETVIWEYIRKQEAEDKRPDQINPWR